MIRLPVIFLLLTVGCSIGPQNLQTRYSSDFESRHVRRIAILPALPAASQQAAKGSRSTGPSAGTRSREEPEGIMADALYSAMASMSGWQIVSESEVRDVGQNLPSGSAAGRLKRVGEMVYADAVITGRVLRYRERVGDEWGVKSPASVAFVVDLVDVKRGDVIWSAHFDETQKSLSENIFALGDIGQRGVRWLTAEQLTREGVKKAVAQLHQMLIRSPTP